MESPASPFRPSRHGFAFANRFDAPLTGSLLGPVLRAVGLSASWGLCGGMVHAARDAFTGDEVLPEHTADAPAPGSPLYRDLLRRQLATFGPPPFFPEVWRYLRWTRCSDAELARRTRSHLIGARDRLAAGRLVPLGLILTRRTTRLWENHQVLAYAVAKDGRRLRVYDPNDPCRDDVTLAPAVGTSGPAFEKRLGGRRARPVRGVFVSRWA